MKCTNCSSQMFVTDETANKKSHVTFYRCSICVSEHVSSQPIEISGQDGSDYFESSGTRDSKRYLMV